MKKLVAYNIALLLKFASLIIALETANIVVLDDIDLHTKIVRYCWAGALLIAADILETYSFKP